MDDQKPALIRLLNKITEIVRTTDELPAYGPALYFWLGSLFELEDWVTFRVLREEVGHDTVDALLRGAVMLSGRYEMGEEGEQAKRRPAAVAILIRNSAGQFAAIRSVKRGGRIGLIAGKIEPKEIYVEYAAIREAREESGLDVKKAIHLDSKHDGEYRCYLVLALEWSGEICSSEEGECFWATREELVGPGSAYPEWNTWALKVLDDYDALHR